MLKQFLRFCYLLLIVIIGACSNDAVTPDAEKPDEPVKNDGKEQIVILHVNDVHANINNFPKIAAYVDKVREENENVFLVSAGDLFSGEPAVDQYNKPGFPIIHLMNELKFDLAVLGNHEFDYGQKILNYRMQQANFPFICANLDASNAVLNQPDAYKKLTTKGGFELFFLGMVETGNKLSSSRYVPSTHPDKVKGIDFKYYRTEIKKYTQYKKDDNMLILLSHLGQGADRRVGKENPKVDLIIGGHSHSEIDKPINYGNALVVQAGSKGDYIGEVRISIEKGKIKSKKGTLIKVSNLTDTKSSISNLVETYKDNPVLKRIIAYSETNITNKNELGALMCDAINWKVNTHMSFQNSGGIRSSIPQGDVSVGDVYKLDPFNNQVVVFRLSCDEIRSLIGTKETSDLKVSGINIRYQGGGIRLEDYDGNELDESKTYKVGLSSYVASARKFSHQDPGQSLSVTTSSSLIEFLEHKKRINYLGVTHVIN